MRISGKKIIVIGGGIGGLAAALALSRSFTRATSAGGALAVGVHDMLTALPHYEPFSLAIGC